MSSSDNYLGNNIENSDQLMTKVSNLSERIERKKTQFQTMKNKIDKLSRLNQTLTSGYELSLKMVVDVSKLLENYTKMFDDLEITLKNLDDAMGIQDVDIRYISELTKQSIQKITTDFNAQYPKIVNELEKQGNRDSANMARKLKTIANDLPVYANDIQRTTTQTPSPSSILGGGNKGTHKKKHKK